MTLKEIREKQARLIAQARSKLDEIKDDTTADRAAEIEREHDAIMSDHDKLEERYQREERLQNAERVIDAPDDRRPVEDRSGQQQQQEQGNQADRFRAAFRSYLRHGMEGCTREERALMQNAVNRDIERRDQVVGTPSAGGYTVPTGFMDELVIALKAYGPMNDTDIIRDLATDSGQTLPWPTMNDTSNKGRRITELTQSDITGASGAKPGISFGQLNLYAWKYTTDVVLVSNELLQDSALDVEQIVNDALAERMGRILNEDLTIGTGSGSDMPTGIVTGAGAGANAAAAAAIAFDDMIELEHAVDPAYRKAANFGWQFADSTLKALRKLKNGDGEYIWQPASVVAKAPATILGYGYSVNQDMAAIGTGNVSVILGDMKKYVRRRVRQLAIRRLTERYADYDAVGFIGFMRADGNILDNRAIKKLTHP